MQQPQSELQKIKLLFIFFLQLINVSFISKYFDTINHKESV